jgi:glycerophosphoryl diester phosphodiesterase
LIEIDVILSRDGELVVCHDLHLDDLTDIATHFPRRSRADGLTYALDLDWPELRTLQAGPRHDGTPAPRVFTPQPLATLDEHLDQLAALNRSTGRRVELYVELKSPAWHTAAGRDLCAAVLACLARHNLTRATDPVIVESFDPAALKRLRFDFKTHLRLTQLLGENAWNEAACDYDALRADAGLREIATYAQAVATNLEHARAPFVRAAHAAGLDVHAYTFRADALPEGYTTTEATLHALLNEAGLDGLFTDQPDVVARFLNR